MKDYAQSALGRIKNIFRETGEQYNSLLLQYAMERFLFRLSSSGYRDQFILKGGVLFYLWTEKKFRPTKDLDFCFYGDFVKDEMFRAIQKICNLDFPEDGLVFSDFRITDIKEDHEYDGVRINFSAWLKKSKIPMQLDISTGDKITPDAMLSTFPKLISLDAPELKTYPKETVFAEKLEAMVKLDLTTSRMKDIYDLYILIDFYGETLDQNTLLEAIAKTFSHRGTELPDVPINIFTEYLYEDSDKLKQWAAFIKKTLDQDLSLEKASLVIAEYVNPLIYERKL